MNGRWWPGILFCCAFGAGGSLAAAAADLEIYSREDVVELNDGKQVAGRILLQTSGKILMAVPDAAKAGAVRQVVIPMEQVRKVRRGSCGGATGYRTDQELGSKVIVGADTPATRPAKTSAPATAAPNTATPKTAGPATRPGEVAPPPPHRPMLSQGRSYPVELTPANLASIYYSRHPGLQEAAELLLGGRAGAAGVQREIACDAAQRAQWQALLSAFIEETPMAAPPVRPVPKPVGPAAKRPATRVRPPPPPPAADKPAPAPDKAAPAP